MSTSGYSKAELAHSFLGVTTFTFNKADRFLRSVAILGAFQKGVDQGMSRAEAIQFAKHVNRKANFDYAITDAPNMFRRTGPLGQVMFQFLKYPIKQLELIGDIFTQGKSFDTTSTSAFGKSLIHMIKTNDKAQMARFFVPYMLLSGMMGIPFISMIGGLIATVLGWEDWEEKTKKAAFEWAGKDDTRKALVRFALYGATAIPTNGADIGYRIGIGDFGRIQLPKTEVEAVSKLFGVAGSSIYQAIRQAAQGNSAEAIKAISPGIGNIAIAMAGEVKSSRNRTKYSYENTWDAILKGLGFMPISERVEGDINYIIKSEEAERRKREQKAIDEYLLDPSSENLQTVRELGISSKRIQNERKKKKQPASDRLNKKEKNLYDQFD